MDALPDLTQLDGVGTVGICVLFAIAFMRGWLVPRRVLADALEDRNRWRAMAEDMKQENTRLLVISELGVNSIRAIEKRAAENGDSP